MSFFFKLKYRQSFSLFELSLYLIAVAVLSSVIMGSSAVYENAKIQKLIEEIYHYENAYVQFTSKYGAIPGNLTYERCIKFQEFTCRLADKTKWTNTDTVLYNAKTTAPISLNTRNYDGINYRPTLLFVMRQLQSAGLINGVKMKLEDVISKIDYAGSQTELNAYNTGHILSHYVIDNVLGHSNYDKDAVIDINGFERTRNNSYLTVRVHYNEAVEPYRSFPNIGGNIFWNGLVIYYNTPANLDSISGSSGVGTTALFTGSTMKKIDVKMDDGKPRQGNVIGTRIYNGVDAANNNVCCYNISSRTNENPFATQPVVAEYTDYRDKARGCNLLYVLPDVKKYLY